MRSRVWSPASPGSGRPLEVREQTFGHRDGFCLVGDDDVDHAVGLLHADRADLVGMHVAESAAGDHRRPAHADRGVLGGDDQIRRTRDHGVAREAAALDDRDARHEARQHGPELERAGIQRGDDGVVGVARSSPAALGEEHGRQAHPLDQFEESVLLAVTQRALGAGEHRVVVGQHGTGGAFVAEEVAVDARRACHQAVARGPGDQIREVAAMALGGDREASVLDEGVRVDEVGDVLPGGAPVPGAPALDGVGSGGVLGERAPPQQLRMVVADHLIRHGVVMLTMCDT